MSEDAATDLDILEQAHTAVVAADRSGTIVRFNRAAARLTGYEPAEAIGLPLDVLLPGAIRGDHRRWVERFATTGHTTRPMGTAGVVQGQRRDGSPYWALASILRGSGPDGPLMTAVLTDITDHHLDAQEALLLRDALANTATAACITDLDGRITHASRPLMALWRRPETASFEGEHLSAVLGDDDLVRQAFDAVRVQRSWVDDLGVRIDGIAHDLRVIARPTFTTTGQVTGAVVTVFDVTRLRRVERDLERNLAILAKAQALTHLGSWTWTIATGALTWSDEVHRIFGTDPSSFTPTLDAFLARVHPEDVDAVQQAVEAAVEGHTAYDIVHRVIRPDGDVRHVREVGEVEGGPDGQPVTMIGTVHDITEDVARMAALEASERFSRSVLDSLTSPTAILDRHGTIVQVNRAWHRLSAKEGVPSTDVGRSYLEVARTTLGGDALADAIADGIGGVLRGERAGLRRDHAVERDGRTTWFELRVEPLDVPDGGAVVLHDDITARKVAEEELAHRALHDPLTGLPNRDLLLQRTAESLDALRVRPGYVGLLFVDLDRFKVVNDTLGHAMGDRVLGAAAGRLRGCVRDDHLIARFGGDEFVVLVGHLDDPVRATVLAERIVAAFVEPIAVAGHEFHLSTSVGVATTGDPDGTAASLLQDADSAMSHAKEQGSARYVVHGAELRQRALERLRLEQDLRGAALRHELSLHLQGQHDLTTGEVVGYEALLRWEHPVHGAVGPDVFIPIAEDTGAIVELGAWVLAEACLLAVEWRERGLLPDHGHIAVNVSPRQLTDPGFVDLVARTLRMTGLPPANLCLEVTESVLMADVRAASQALEALAAVGIRIALDDFGTGHASLGYLTSLPLDELKIDRTFVAALGTDRRADAVASSIIALAETLGLEVVAEGIETDEQRAWLQEMSCQRGQGYLLSRPRPAEEIDRGGELVDERAS